MRLALCLVCLGAVLALSGCTAMASGPVTAILTIDEKGPVSVGDMSVKAEKMGVSKAEGILVFAWGDASIDAACKSQGITRIHHVDRKIMNVLGIYACSETYVYGQ